MSMDDMDEMGGMPRGAPQQGGQPMPSEQEIMVAGMVALGLMTPEQAAQMAGGAQQMPQGQPPAQGQPMPQPGGNPNARIAQMLMK